MSRNESEDIEIPNISSKLENNELRFENINYSAIDSKGTRKQILTNISGSSLSRDVFAILGPSGSLLQVFIIVYNILDLHIFRCWKDQFVECANLKCLWKRSRNHWKMLSKWHSGKSDHVCQAFLYRPSRR